MRAVAGLLTLSLLVPGCFPNNPRHRTIAKITEGGLIAGGVALLAVSNTGADCDSMSRPGVPTSDCKREAGVTGGIGLGLILVGMVGFIATVSTTPDTPAPAATAPTPAPVPATTPPAPPAHP
ncbi:MAG TPA: hypothetical protein VFQ53_38660 [Kofleriaceae bacterium]|nr:hypothetical protein [Kofleriaceae bacterium]